MTLTRDNVRDMLAWMAERLHDESPIEPLIDPYLAVCASTDFDEAARAAVRVVETEKRLLTPDEFALVLLDVRLPAAPPTPAPPPAGPVPLPGATEGQDVTPDATADMDTLVPGWPDMDYRATAAALAESLPGLPRDRRIAACRWMERRFPGKGWGDEADKEARR